MKIKGILKEPGAEARQIAVNPLVKNITKTIGGMFGYIHIRLTTGKLLIVFYPQDSIGKEYNFSICPTENKKTYIDISGKALIFQTIDKVRLLPTILTEEEKTELFKIPYEQ